MNDLVALVTSGFEYVRAHPLWDTTAWLLLAGVVLLVRQLAHRSLLGRYFDRPLLLIAAGVCVGGAAILARVLGWDATTPYFDATILSLLLLGSARLLLTLFVDFYLRERQGAAISAIFRDAGSLLVYFFVIVVVLRTTLDVNVASVIATSAVLTAIIGLALQDVLNNLFSGLVIEAEAPFAPGDWVQVGDFVGTIEETGWRSTKLRTRANERIILPNTFLSKEAVVNYSRPDPLYADMLPFSVAYEAPPNLVKETGLAMLYAHPYVVRDRPSEVRLVRYGESSIEYMLRYWTVDFARLEITRSEIFSNLWYALRRAGIRIPFPARDVYVHQPAQAHLPDARPRLRSVPLFAPLGDELIDLLAERVLRETFGVGEVVVHEGEPGELFYIIESGSAEVTVRHAGVPHVVGFLRSGDFFGEMSLLTGEPRTATVRVTTDLSVLGIDRESFRKILIANPAVLEPVSEFAAKRQAAQDERRRELSLATDASQAQQAQRLRERIKSLFGI